LFTVRTLVALVPHPVLYEIVVVPAVSGDIIPEVALIVATLVVLLLQVPFAIELVNVRLVPVHALLLPEIAEGVVETVTILVAEQAALL
jgi:hypothetical protein